MIELEYKVLIHSQGKTEQARVRSNVRIVDPRAIYNLSRRACKDVMYKPAWRGVFGTDLSATSYRYRFIGISYRTIEKHFMARQEKYSEWSEWLPMSEVIELMEVQP